MFASAITLLKFEEKIHPNTRYSLMNVEFEGEVLVIFSENPDLLNYLEDYYPNNPAVRKGNFLILQNI